MRANLAAADTYGTAVASPERVAAFVPFQRQPVGLPLHKNVNLAVSSLLSATRFSGKCAVVTATATATSISVDHLVTYNAPKLYQ